MVFLLSDIQFRWSNFPWVGSEEDKKEVKSVLALEL